MAALNKENGKKQQACISHYFGNTLVYENPVAWENSCSAPICHAVFKLEEKLKAKVKTTRLIHGCIEVLKLISRLTHDKMQKCKNKQIFPFVKK